MTRFRTMTKIGPIWIYRWRPAFYWYVYLPNRIIAIGWRPAWLDEELKEDGIDR